jgi:sRNA-binding regulator protein Hfq
MDQNDVGKEVKIIMVDGFVKRGKVLQVNDNSILIEYLSREGQEEIFYNAISSIVIL